jgi:hypothetical protein
MQEVSRCEVDLLSKGPNKTRKLSLKIKPGIRAGLPERVTQTEAGVSAEHITNGFGIHPLHSVSASQIPQPNNVRHFEVFQKPDP